RVRDLLLDEQRRFEGLLRRGRRVVSRRLSRGPLSEQDYDDLHDTHGLPRELVLGLLSNWTGGDQILSEVGDTLGR
ncbi:MAG TPA: hypothetical protein VFR67_26455, partial [Pilimelia sp.]|nr:hypothetical protein [Pilimelia sp.]